ncbi:MAG: lipoate--protein ligase family protein [Leptospiraceae bacterium]|nr:lipoate--protein ligase family protein [Leptospiraceae bacterium]MCP5499934.1 lipoate--protein ligase family protein [Leptospiraceae bacterium]
MPGLFYLDTTTLRNPYYNLALEEAIALKLTSSIYSAGLRFWKNENTIVLGRSDSVSKNIKSELIHKYKKQILEKTQFPKLMKENGVPFILRRASGGGTVFHSSDSNLNFSFFVSLKEKEELYPVKDSYEILLSLLIKALSRQGIVAFSGGKSDLVFKEESGLKKISGNAQFRKKNCIVHHGTLILNRDFLPRIEENLSHPPEEPEYRQKRKHSEFISALPSNFRIERFKQDLKELFFTYIGIKGEEILPFSRSFWREVIVQAEELLIQKYGNADFIFSIE